MKLQKALVALILAFFTYLNSSDTAASNNDPSHIFGTPRVLNHYLAEGEGVGSFNVSNDNQWVVYKAGSEIFSVPLQGGQARQISQQIDSKQFIGDWKISPDSKWVVYTRYTNSDERILLSAPIQGGTSTRLDDDGRSSAIFHFVISPDSQTVVYYADENVYRKFEIFEVPIIGGPVANINQPLVSGGDVSPTYLFDANNSYLIYVADQDVDNKREIFSVSLRSGDVRRLNPELPDTADVIREFTLDSSNGRVIYIVENDLDDRIERTLYSSQITNGETEVLAAASDSTLIYKMHQPNGRIVFAQGNIINSVFSDGTEATVLGELPSDYNKDIKFSHDGKHVAFKSATPNFLSEYRTYTATIDSANSVTPLNITELYGEVSMFEFMPDNSGLVFSADGHDPSTSLSFATIDNNGAFTPVRRLFSKSVLGDARIEDFLISSDSQRIILELNSISDVELYSVNLKNNTNSKVTVNDIDARKVLDFSLSPNGDTLLFTETSEIFAYEIQPTLLYVSNLEPPSESLCVPIVTKNGKIASICL